MSIPSQLNQYRLLEPLGKGGMGEVFAAEDTRLHRKVAIKVLPGLLASEPERRRRFEREAQAVAALNHPNIVTIHAVEEADGIPFIVMELVEGRTLADLIRAGRIGLDLLLRVGVGVSDAVAVAHQRGITHRDLKPANVMVTADGRVKVLDFGLAKLREAEAEYDGETRLPSGDLTGAGRILGTVAYMSPEQAEGKPVDPRSDIFSLGVMLHEMAVGERPFKGDTNVSIISSILKDTPSSISDINPALPPALGRVIRRSLAKDPSRRYQSALDLRNELEELKQELDAGAMTVTDVSRTRRPAGAGMKRPVVVGTVALLAIAAAGAYWLRRAGTAEIPWSAERVTRLTSSGVAQLAAISRDGRYVVHSKNDGLRPSLWIRQTAAASDVQIVPPAAVRYDGLTFSPDGNFVYFVTYDLTGGVATLFKVPALGGPPQRVLEDIDSRITFSPDGGRFAFVRGFPADNSNFLMLANADGTGVRKLGTIELPDQLVLNSPAWSPDGKTILVPAQSLREGPHGLCIAFDAESGASRVIGGRWAVVQDLEWIPDGRSFIASGSDPAAFQSLQLWQVAYPSGERRRITVDLNTYTGLSISADGASLATVQSETNASLWIVPVAEPSKATQITRPRGSADGLSGLTWLPDERLVYGSTASGNPQLWIAGADGGNPRQLTSADAAATGPSASMDGRILAYQVIRPNGIFVSRMAPDGTDAQQVTTTGGDFNATISPDGKWIYYVAFTTWQGRAARIPADGGQPVMLGETRFSPHAVSPDGRRVLGSTWNEAARRSTLAVIPAEGGSPALLNLPVINRAVWTPDGQGVTYVDVTGGTQNVWTRPIDGGTPRQLTSFTSGLIFGMAWSPDGQRLAVSRGSVSTDVVILARK